MITIQQAKQQLKEVLASNYSQREASTISSMLLQHITGFTISEQLVNQLKIFTNIQHTIFNHSLQKLKLQTPIQHIIGYCWFDDEQYIVNKDVLVPRPETEELLQWIKQEKIEANTIIDIGTGSGILALSFKKHFANSKVHAVDVSNRALFIAKQNAVAKHRFINFHEIDFLDKTNWDALPNCNLIVSNPPYIMQQEESLMHQNVLLHEPHTALFVPNNNALVFYEAIATFANEKLEMGGYIFVEINEALGNQTAELFNSFGFNTILKKDLQTKDRMIKAWKAV